MNTRGEMRDYIIPSCGTHVHGLEVINVRELRRKELKKRKT